MINSTNGSFRTRFESCVIFRRKKRNAGAITALNFYLGWTVIGWIVALVWAMTVDVGSGSGQ